MILGLTGGVATGKSTFGAMLASKRAFAWFDADRCVHELLASDPAVIGTVAALFGASVVGPDGGINRSALRPLVFPSPERRRQLEAVIHPVVRARWQARASDCRAAGADLVCDIPLLFETGAEGFFDATVLVAAREETQAARLAARGLDVATAQAMLASQWPLRQKIALADRVVWNDGDLASLETQADLLLELLFR